MSPDPLRPTVLKTVLYEPDQGAVLAVLPGGLWLAPGDIVELDDPPREARVLSTRLQLRRDEVRVLVVLDVPDQPNDVLRGATPTDVALGTDIDQSLPVSDALDDALEKLIDEVQLEPAPDEAPQQ
jgi:hypothetical protein